MKKQKNITCNWLDLETLGYRLIMPEISSHTVMNSHWALEHHPKVVLWERGIQFCN